jgi:hypothetical protein
MRAGCGNGTCGEMRDEASGPAANGAARANGLR